MICGNTIFINFTKIFNMSNRRIKAAIIGFGRIGGFYLREMSLSDKWEVSYICDVDKFSQEEASQVLKELNLPYKTLVIDDEDIVFSDSSVEVVILSALADSRYGQFEKAISTRKHIITEKPLSDKIEKEWEIVKKVSSSGLLSTINLPLRNAWYNLELRKWLESGELGELAIIRICHLTPGLAPGEGHGPEGPCFHDCGMHYVDLARWLAGSEYKTWHAQGVDFWDWGEPWWLQCHGTFENGVTFDITQGHMYGQLSKDLTHISYNDIIGTKGVARMTHDYKTAIVEIHGVTKTVRIEKQYGDKNINILLDLFADSVRSGIVNPALPTLRDGAMASEYAWRFLEDASKNDLPVKGDKSTLKKILYRREVKGEGYGVLKKKNLIK